MLPEPRQVDELEIDHLDLQVFGLGKHMLGRGLGFGYLWPGRDGHSEAHSSRCRVTRVLVPSRGACDDIGSAPSATRASNKGGRVTRAEDFLARSRGVPVGTV